MEFGVETQRGRAAQNVLTKQSGLSRFALCMADYSVTAYQVIFNNHMLKLIQQCTNVEARRVLGNEEWEVSLCELNALSALLYVRGAYDGKNFPLTIFGIKNGAHHFFNKPCLEIVVVKVCVFCGSTCVAQG